MADEPQDIKNLWQKQEVENMRMSIDELRRKASAFQKRIRRRNVREYVAAILVIVAFSWMFAASHRVVPRIACGLIVIATFWMVYNLYSRGTARALTAEMGSTSCIEFYRRELERQRDLLRSIWSWYLGPFVPGMAILIAFSIVTSPPDRRWFSEVYAVVAAAFFWGIGYLNIRAARRLQRQIEELKGMEKADE